MNNAWKLIAQQAFRCMLMLLGSVFLVSQVAAAEQGVTYRQEQVNVVGTVRSGSEPLAGVSVSSVANASVGASTNDEGNYSISVSGNDTLLFSFVGYVPQRVAVNGRTRVDVELLPLDQHLEEIVVVGYGTQKRANLTGAISTIQADEIQTTTHSSLAQKLQGKVPGLQIRQHTGGTGDFNAMINIRGFGSPLYVIDGIVRDGGSEFQRLSPDDIESISVLKDASAAIYGVNAANGVII